MGLLLEVLETPAPASVVAFLKRHLPLHLHLWKAKKQGHVQLRMNDHMLPKSGSLRRPMFRRTTAQQFLGIAAMLRLFSVCGRCVKDYDGPV